MLLVSRAHMRLKRAFRQRIVSSLMSSGLCPACLLAGRAACGGSSRLARLLCAGRLACSAAAYSAHTLRAAALSETTSEFDAVYREGRRRSSREFAIFVRANGLPVSRFGWSIKKALGTAVRRNRIRRRLREIVRLHRREIAGGWDVVIHPRASVATADFAALTAELMKLLPRAKAAQQSKE